MPAIAVSVTQPGALRSSGRRPAVMLCAELRNFTRLSEALEPSTVLQLASRFFQLASDAAALHDGELISTFNDSVACAFKGGPPTQFAQRALRAAQTIQREFGVLAEEWSTAYGLRSGIAIGLHLGDTVFGPAGPAGAEQPVAFGDSLSVATRLMQRARAGEFVVSDSVMGALSLSNLELSVEPLPPLQLSQRPALGIYGVLLDMRLDFT
jgi:adenylate cyclase